MNKKYFFHAMIFAFLLISAFSFFSCATKPRYEGTANLTGLIVDEFNEPIYGFPVTASSGLIIYETAVTNESGIFVIQNVRSGKISFSGKKSGYAFLDRSENFYQRDRIVCFQISSADAVLDKADEKLMQDDYEGGLEEVKKICAKWGSPVYAVVREYEKFCKLGKKNMRVNKSKNKEVSDEKI